MDNWRGFAALAVMVFGLAAAVAPRAKAAEPGAEWQKTVEAAKKEGQLSVFMFLRDNIETAVTAFQKKYPEIQVTTVALPAPQLAPRIMAERRADKYLWDVYITDPTTPYTILYPAKALDPIKPAFMLPEVLDESRWWGGKHHYVDPQGHYIFVFSGTVTMPNLYYNKNLVVPKEFKSYWDLLNPSWRGKIVVVDPRQAGRQRVGTRILYHIPEIGPKFLTRLFTEMDVTLSRDDRQAMDWLAVGRYPLCLFCGGINEAKAQGLAVGEFDTVRWRETPVISSGSNGTIALMNRAPHPHAAKVFVNWLLSREGQTSFQRIMNAADVVIESMRTDIPKDPIPAAKRRVEGLKYIVMDTPERTDQAPVTKLLNEVIKK